MSKKTSREIIADIIERSGIIERPGGSRVILHLSVLNTNGPHPHIDKATEDIMISIVGSMDKDEYILDEHQGFIQASDNRIVCFGYSEVNMDTDNEIPESIKNNRIKKAYNHADNY